MRSFSLIIFTLLISSCSFSPSKNYQAREPAQSSADTCRQSITKVFELRAHRIVENAGLSQSDRVSKAESALGLSFSDQQQKALLLAHQVGDNEIGLDGINSAGIRINGESNFTRKQVLQKVRTLRNGGFSADQARRLLDDGFAGGSRYKGLTIEQKAALKKQEKLFKDEVLPNIPKYNVKKLPKDDKLKFHTFYSAVRDFLDEPKKVFQRVKDLEIEAIRRKNANPDMEMPKIVEEILSEMETKHGFKKAVDLEDKAYSADDWWTMLRQGALFNDTSFRSATDVRSGHGELTHRIQWYALMREIDLNPARFAANNEDLPATVEIYKFLGNKKINPSYKIDGNDLWFTLFDAFSGTFHQPEYFHPAHKYWEAISWQ